MQIIDSADRARGYRLSPILALAAAPAHTGSSPARSLAAAPDVPGPPRSLLEAQPQPLISQASPPLPVAAGEAGSDALACAPPPLAGDDDEAAWSGSGARGRHPSVRGGHARAPGIDRCDHFKSDKRCFDALRTNLRPGPLRGVRPPARS